MPGFASETPTPSLLATSVSDTSSATKEGLRETRIGEIDYTLTDTLALPPKTLPGASWSLVLSEFPFVGIPAGFIPWHPGNWAHRKGKTAGVLGLCRREMVFTARYSVHFPGTAPCSDKGRYVMLVDPETQLLTDWTMKFLSMLATWFAACGTTAAVVVALWLARRSDKVRLNASVGVYVMFESDRSEEGMLIAVTNLGDRPVTIASVSWTIGKWKADNRSAIDKNVLNQCPAKLEHGETKHFFTSFSHGREPLLRSLVNALQITTRKQVETLRVRIHTSVGYTKDVVPAEDLLKKFEETAESRNC